MSKYIPVKEKYYETQRKQRLGEKQINNQGLLMTVTKYNKYIDMEVTFEDGTIVNTNYYSFTHGTTHNDNYKKQVKTDHYNNKVGEISTNNQGYKMKIIKADDWYNIYVEFQDNYKTIVKTDYGTFKKGQIKNPCKPGKYGQITGSKYSSKEKGSKTKEYNTWNLMFSRVNESYKEKNKSYKDIKICDEWYYYPNFFEWITSQENYELWKNNDNWAIDKDILSDPNNKIYSPDTCCLVPRFINDAIRMFHKEDGMPNGVCQNGKGYSVRHVLSGKTYFSKLEDALKAYYEYKEDKIKNAAKTAYNNNLITEKCYKGLLNYTNY